MRKKITIIIIASFLMCLIMTFNAYAESQYDYETVGQSYNNTINIEGELGIQGQYKTDRNVPVKITVTNSGSATFTGKVRVVEVVDSKDTLSYEYDIEVEKDSNIIINEVIFIKSDIDLLLEVVNSNNVTISTATIDNEPDNILSETLTIGVISRNVNMYNCLEQDNVAYFSETDSKVIGITGMIPIKNYQILDMFDIIIINNYDTSAFTTQTVQAIKKWVYDGGILIVGTGRYVNSTIPMFENWFDVKYTGNNYYDTFIGDYDGDKQILIPMYELNIEGATLQNIYSSNENRSAIQTKYFGAGRVTFLEFNFEDDNIVSLLEYSPSNAGEFINLTAGYEVVNNVSNEYYNRFNNLWSITNMLSSIIIENVPNIELYAGIIALYLFIIGPGIYYLYKKKKNFYFSVIIVTSCIFTVVIYIIGKKTRFEDAFINYATIIKINNDTEIETSFFNIRNSLSRPFSFGIDSEYDIEPQFVNSDEDGTEAGYEKPSITRRKTADCYAIDINNVKSFDEKNFKIMRSSEETDMHFGEIKYYNGRISGTIYNSFDHKLECGMLIINNVMVYIGDIEAHEEIDLEKCEVYSIDTTLYSTVMQHMDKDNHMSKTVTEQRRSILEYFLDYNSKDAEKNPQFIAFDAEKKKFNAQSISDYDTNGITMYSIDMAIDTYEDNTKYMYDIDDYVSCVEGTIDADGHKAYTQAIELNIDIGAGVTIDNIHINWNVCNEDTWESERFKGKIYILNTYTGEYEQITGDDINTYNSYTYTTGGMFSVRIIADDDSQATYRGYYYPAIGVTVEKDGEYSD